MQQMFMTAAFIWLAITTATFASEKDNLLPDAQEVKTVTIKFDHPNSGKVEFTAGPDDWKAIRATLLPAKRAKVPATWEWLGTVKIVTQDDKPFRVELYAPSEETGAFAVGKTFEQRVYYRGGKTEDLKKAINVAYDKSKDKDK